MIQSSDNKDIFWKICFGVTLSCKRPNVLTNTSGLCSLLLGYLSEMWDGHWPEYCFEVCAYICTTWTMPHFPLILFLVLLVNCTLTKYVFILFCSLCSGSFSLFMPLWLGLAHNYSVCTFYCTCQGIPSRLKCSVGITAFTHMLAGVALL